MCVVTNNHGSSKVIIIGAGGFGREVLQYALDTGRFEVKGYIDDRSPSELKIPQELPILGTVAGYSPSPGESFLLAVGAPAARARVAARFLAQGARFETIIHPKAYVSSTAKIGAGCIIAPFATVGACATIGDFSQVHFYASAAHDSVIGQYSALSPYSVVNGGGHLGEGVFLGTRATVNPIKSVGSYSRVAAGAVVYLDVPAWSLAAGNPAKSRRLMTANGDQAEGQQEPP